MQTTSARAPSGQGAGEGGVASRAAITPIPPPDPRPPTVFHLRSSGGLFGADRVVLDLCHELAGAGYRAVLVPLIEPGEVGRDLRAAAESMGIPVRPLVLRHRFDGRAVAWLRRLAAIEGAEILHGHDYKTNFLIRLAAPPDTFRVATLHGRVGTDWKLRLYEAAESLLVRRFDRVICVSEPMRAAEESRGTQPVVIPNGIDLERFSGTSKPSAELRADLGLPADAEVVGSVGRLSAEKGYDVLVRAAAELLPERPRLHLLLIGDGAEYRPLRELALSLGFGDRLHLPGIRQDAPALYPLLDVFCLPSHREGLPLALLEAMASGRPAVVTPVGGIPEVIGDPPEAALTVHPGDTGELARALAHLLDDSGLRARLGAAARRRVEEGFSRARMARSVGHLYDGLRARAAGAELKANRRRNDDR